MTKAVNVLPRERVFFLLSGTVLPCCFEASLLVITPCHMWLCTVLGSSVTSIWITAVVQHLCWAFALS